MTESDGLALAMLVVLLISFGVIASLLAFMLRSSSRRDSEVDRLLEELAREEKAEKSVKPGPAAEEKQEWEKDGDWWKG